MEQLATLGEQGAASQLVPIGSSCYKLVDRSRFQDFHRLKNCVRLVGFSLHVCVRVHSGTFHHVYSCVPRIFFFLLSVFFIASLSVESLSESPSRRHCFFPYLCSILFSFLFLASEHASSRGVVYFRPLVVSVVGRHAGDGGFDDLRLPPPAVAATAFTFRDYL